MIQAKVVRMKEHMKHNVPVCPDCGHKGYLRPAGMYHAECSKCKYSAAADSMEWHPEGGRVTITKVPVKQHQLEAKPFTGVVFSTETVEIQFPEKKILLTLSPESAKMFNDCIASKNSEELLLDLTGIDLTAKRK